MRVASGFVRNTNSLITLKISGLFNRSILGYNSVNIATFQEVRNKTYLVEKIAQGLDEVDRIFELSCPSNVKF
jgi:hypothetical protein